MASHQYVIIGAGSAGCVLANRLSAGGRSVLLLESGGSNRNLGVKAPAAFSTLFQGPRDWNYLSEPEPALHGRRLYLPRGRMLGGSSSMNAMMYVRGNRVDYDDWAKGGATGWSYDEVLPYFKRSEDNAEFHDSYHGVGGEQHVTSKRWLSRHWEPFLDAAAAVGVPRIADCNGPEQDGGVLIQTTTRKGRRWSGADAFLAPVRKRENLTVETGAHVRRIVIEGGRAVGVEYEQKGQPQTARAEGEVILSAGAYGSPQLLMLGVGPGAHLREHGIGVVLDQPNVGAHLQEHPMALTNYRATTDDTLDDAADPRYLAVAARRPWQAVVQPRRSRTALALRFVAACAGLPGRIRTGLLLGARVPQDRSAGTDDRAGADPADEPRQRPPALGRSHRPPPDLHQHALGEQRDRRDAARDELAREIACTPPFTAHAAEEELNPSDELKSTKDLTAWLRATCEHEYHPCMHLPNRHPRGGRGRSRASSARDRGASGGKRIGHAADHHRQHQRPDGDDRGALCRPRAQWLARRRPHPKAPRRS